ncbi:protein kinase [Aggregatilineales bacterium SYSU G02658]
MQEVEQIGLYILEEQIGKGGMATVYRARHVRLERHVAIKIMHTVLLHDESFRQRFEREAQIVAKLEHPHIVPIYDYSEHNGSPYLVMKYIDGVTLKQQMLKTTLSLSDILRLMRTLADALDYAHRQGVLHRDLKPSNIMIDREGRPYLTDFGLARMAQVGESTISHDMMLGTPFYVSPEQAQGQRDLSSLTDIYSFGVVLYELITGVVPFAGDSAYAIIHDHIYAAPEPPSQKNPALPRALDAVLLKALAKRPEDRYSTATALMNAFAAAIGSEDAPPVEAAAAPQHTPPARQTGDKAASAEVYIAPDGRRGRVEAALDLSRVDFNQIGHRIERWGERVEQWGEEVEAKVEESNRNRFKKRHRSKEEALTEEEKIRRRIEKQQKELRNLVGSIVMFVLINSVIWIGAIANSSEFPSGLIFMTGFWGLGVAFHVWDYYTNYGPGARYKEERIARAIEEELGKPKNKAKNDLLSDKDNLSLGEARSVRLTEDGELTDTYIEEIQGRRMRR